MKVLIIMFSLDISGGNNILLNHVLQARDAGWEVTVCCPKSRMSKKPLVWHQAFQDKSIRFATFEDAIADTYDVAMPTYFETYYMVDRVQADRVVYFVQSIESRFFGKDLFDSERADLTYVLPTGYIVVADWIGDYLREVYGHSSTKVRNGINKSLFTSEGPLLQQKSTKVRVLIEGAAGSPFKRVRQTIELACRVPNTEIWWLTPHDKEPLPGVHRFLSGLPQSQIPSVLRSCDILVKLSSVEGMFGPPLEMFHCGGTAITTDVTGYDEYIVDGRNALVVNQQELVRTVDALQLLVDSSSVLQALREGALETAKQWPDEVETGKAFWKAVDHELETGTASMKDVRRHMSVVRRLCRVYLLAPRNHDSQYDPHRAVLTAMSRFNRAVDEGHPDLAARRLEDGIIALSAFGIDANDRIRILDIILDPPADFVGLDLVGRLKEYCYHRGMALLNFDNLPAHAASWFGGVWTTYVELGRRHDGAAPANALLAPQALRHMVIARHREQGGSHAWSSFRVEIDAIEPALLYKISKWNEFWQALHEMSTFLLPSGDLTPAERRAITQLQWLSHPDQNYYSERADMLLSAIRGGMVQMERSAEVTEPTLPVPAAGAAPAAAFNGARLPLAERIGRRIAQLTNGN